MEYVIILCKEAQDRIQYSDVSGTFVKGEGESVP